MSKIEAVLPVALIVILIIWMFAAMAYSSWADVECNKLGHDTARSSLFFTYACWDYKTGAARSDSATKGDGK